MILVKKASFVFFSLLVFLSGCAATGPKYMPVEESLGGKAKIVFYRPKELQGAAVKLIIKENGSEILRIQNGQFVEYTAKPEENVYSIKTVGKSENLVLDLEPDAKYYVRTGIRSGMVVNTLYLTRVYDDEAIKELETCCRAGK